MAENNFLSGIKVDQFIKANNDQIKQTIGSAFGDAQKSVAELIKLQKITVLELKKVNEKGTGSKDLKKSLDSTLRSIQKENLKMSKSRDATIIKSLKGFFSKTKQTTATKQESRDYFRKENYTKKSNSLLESINKGISGLLKKDKEEKKESLLSKILGFAGFLGKALAIGGLAGFLLTGKKEFLFSMVKGVRWMVKSALMPIQLVLKGVPMLIKGISTGFKSIQAIAKSFIATTKVGKAVASAGAKIAGSKVGQKVAGVVGSKAIQTGIKTAGKVASKSVAKAGVKKIPIIGAVMGVGFGIARIQKGDVIGGLLEFGSGIASIFPGVGTAISLGIDGIILAKDINSTMKSNSPKAPASASGIKMPSGSNRIGDAYGGGSSKPSFTPKKVSTTDAMSKVKSALFSKSVFKSKNPTKVRGGKGMSVGGIGSNLASAIGSQGSLGAKLTAVGGVGAEVFNNVVSGSDGVGWRKNNSSVDVSGMNPAIWHNFVGMAQEYASKGGVIDINSAYRSPEKQKKLWDEAVRTGRTKYVARPGRSMHEFGYAIDMNSSDGNALDRMGLLSKWHFDRPMGHEPWHTELKGLKGQYDAVRGGKMKYAGEKQGGGVKGGVGDAYSMVKKLTPKNVSIPKNLLGSVDSHIDDFKSMGVSKLTSGMDKLSSIPQSLADKANLPIGNIANRIQNSKPMQVLLGASDITTLAKAIGDAIKNAIPTPKTNTIPASGGGRGSL